jgi:hypothetical protein
MTALSKNLLFLKITIFYMERSGSGVGGSRKSDLAPDKHRPDPNTPRIRLTCPRLFCLSAGWVVRRGC